MYLIVTSIYPNDKSKEVANTYVEAMTKYPDDASLATPVVPVAVHAVLEGIKIIMVHDIKKGKFEEAWALIDARMGMFLDIQGFRYTFETYANLEEALRTIGM